MPKLLFVLNDAGYFLSHRLQIAQAARAAGFDVHVATPESDKTKVIRAHGFAWHPLPMTRSGTRLFPEIAAFWRLIRLFHKIKPDLLHLVTIKPVLYGGIAARLTRVPAVVAAVPGLGFVFSRQGFKASLIRFLVGLLYRMALGHPNLRAIFQNTDNAQCIARLAVLPAEKICLIRGAGVDLADYAASPLPDGMPLVILPARMLKDKGILEFVEAARRLRQNGCEARFALVGEPDPGNPASLTEANIDEWLAEGVVEYFGYRSDMPEVLKMSSLVVLPSYHEGMPRALMEAQACGRAVVTTDVPGCRDAITPNVTGLLVPPRDAAALAEAIGALLDDRERLQAMGKAGRALAEEAFDVREVVRQHLEIYRSLMERV
ncbi:MAG: glycosyltransferase family 4 protein [Zoogloeaceae bacterium]|jgi:glycosyltransferase involved in cell wall biosynthesis|nr:glycosyltransferase family 4 protein [Zoogloeaceae bacterium]